MKRPELRAGAATPPQAGGGERLCHPQGGLPRLLRRLERLEGRLHRLVNPPEADHSLTPGCLPGPTVQGEEEKGPK